MKIRIRLWNYVKYEYTKEIEVPDETTNHELDLMAVKMKDEICPTEYERDPDFWQDEGCFWEKVQ